MLEETRLHRIRALLTTLNQLSTEQLIQHLGVSRETVRRDVLKLEAMGALRRVHGGVVSTEPAPEPPLSVRSTVRDSQKRAIAQAAVKELAPGQTLFIDAGSTTLHLAEALLSMPGLCVITNSLNVAMKLGSVDNAELDHEVILLGGRMGASQATCSAETIREIQRHRADLAILSPVGIAAGAGASSFSHDEAAVAGAMVSCAKRFMVLADHSKIGVTSRIVYAGMEEVDSIITDTRASDSPDLELLRQGCDHILIT